MLDRMVRMFGELRRWSAYEDEGMPRSRELQWPEISQRDLRDAQLRIAGRLGHVVALDPLRW